MYPKIVSLLPAATEIICALGLEQNLAGRSHECDFPESIKALPACTQSNIPDGIGSLAIDTRVKSLLADALSIYTVNRDLIKSLAPDIVLTQAQCEVCAVSLPDVEAGLRGYLEKNTEIISLSPQSLADVLTDIQTVAQALHVAEEGRTLVEELQERIDIIRHKLKFMENRPTVCCVEWMEPLMVSGNWMPEMISMAGGVPILAEAGKRSPAVNWGDILEQDPDVMTLMPCGFSVEQTLREIDLILNLPAFSSLSAVRNKRFYLADGNHYFNRPGPRLVDSLEILAEIIHPQQFIFGYEGNGWVRFDI